MKKITGIITFLIATNCFAQTTYPGQLIAPGTIDSLSPKIILFENFNNNNKEWTVADNKNVRSKIEDGIYNITAVGHAYGEAQEVKIDSRKNFEIETRIKIISGNAEHRNYYSMLFWGREAMNGYYFTFAKDGFASVETCDGKNQSDCITKTGSLQKTMLNPEDFNVYRITKTGRIYSFYINGTKIYEMAFTPFYGNLIGIGAGRKVTLAIDYLKVAYL